VATHAEKIKMLVIGFDGLQSIFNKNGGDELVTFLPIALMGAHTIFHMDQKILISFLFPNF
jgi:hypothetical protein